MSNKVVILGGAQSDFSENYSSASTGFIDVLRYSYEKAMETTEIPTSSMDSLRADHKVGAFVGNFNSPRFLNQGHLGAFLSEVNADLTGIPSARYEAACASGSVAIDAARSKIQSGDIDLAIVFGVEIMRTVNPQICNDYLAYAADYEKEGTGIRFYFPRIFGTLADLIIERSERLKSGADESRIMNALSAISKNNYSNAKSNPLSQTRNREIDKLEDMDKKFAKTFGGRTRYSDCSQVTDGSSVVILASESFAKKSSLSAKKQARISGHAHRTAPILWNTKAKQSVSEKYIFPWTRLAIQEAYARAKIDRAESIDVFETHDCFTSSEYVALSALGLCEPGKEYQAIEDGMILKTGKSPVNPSGGLIGGGHPVGATGVRMMYDLYKQVTDQSGDMQIPGAKRGAMLNIGGSFTTNYVFVVEKEN